MMSQLFKCPERAKEVRSRIFAAERKCSHARRCFNNAQNAPVSAMYYGDASAIEIDASRSRANFSITSSGCAFIMQAADIGGEDIRALDAIFGCRRRPIGHKVPAIATAQVAVAYRQVSNRSAVRTVKRGSDADDLPRLFLRCEKTVLATKSHHAASRTHGHIPPHRAGRYDDTTQLRASVARRLS